LPFFPLLLLQTVLCFVFGMILGATFINLGAVLVIFLLLGITCISLGVLLGALFTVGQVSAVGSLLITVVSLMSGAWMDLKLVGGVFEQIGYAMPFAHAIDSARAVLKGGSLSAESSSLLLLGGYALASTILAVIAFRRTMRKQ
jgi:ABC-2 type transport system permease protein